MTTLYKLRDGDLITITGHLSKKRDIRASEARIQAKGATS